MAKTRFTEEILPSWKAKFEDPLKQKIFFNGIKGIVLTILKFAILIGVSYVIISPVIGMLVNSISSDADAMNPMVFVLPKNPTLEKYALAIKRLEYWKTLFHTLVYTTLITLIQLCICSMVGYGFARFEFPLKKVWFALVILTIVIPVHTVMLPIYITFKDFNPFTISRFFNENHTVTNTINGTFIPVYIMTFLGTGLRSGLFIYIFNQFFRGLPKEIEEAAFVDGAGMWYTYFGIMLRNSMPAVITVTVFSFVWQFNDTFFAKLFLIPNRYVISKRIASLQGIIANEDNILSTTLQELYRDAGAMLVIIPVVIVYLVLQKNFIEGVERSGIVG